MKDVARLQRKSQFNAGGLCANVACKCYDVHMRMMCVRVCVCACESASRAVEYR